MNSLVFVELAPGEPPVRLLVVDEMTDVGVHLGEDEGDVVAEADLPAPDGLDGRRAALAGWGKILFKSNLVTSYSYWPPVTGSSVTILFLKM